jgi:AhpD family alkylhydroperoxidase
MATVKGTYARSTLGQVLMSLVDLRVSQINGCAFCVDMHASAPRWPGPNC